MKYTDETISAFLAGELDEATKLEFEEDLTNDSELKERVGFFREMDEMLIEDDWSLTNGAVNKGKLSRQYRQFLEGEEGKSYFDLLQNTDRQFFSEDKKIKQFPRWIGSLPIAASVVLLLASVFFYITWESSSMELYTHYRSATKVPSLINRGNESVFLRYDSLLQAHNYEAALTWIDGYISNESKSINPQLYVHKGVLLLDLEKTDEAIKTFNVLLNSNTVDSDKAYWYLTLSFLKANDKKQALQQLKALINSGSTFNRLLAIELLESLE